jgi:uncharacterized protein (TIGR01244 family)
MSGRLRTAWTWSRRALLGTAVLFAVVVVVRLATKPPFRRWVEVERGVFYRSALLPPDDLARAVDRYGIRTVVNLRTKQDDRDRAEAETLAAIGVALVHVPVAPRRPPSDEQVRDLLALFDDRARRPVLVHCSHGNVRAAGIEALFRREYLGETAEAALAAASRFGWELRENAPRIARFIEEYRPRASGAPSTAAPAGVPSPVGEAVPAAGLAR